MNFEVQVGSGLVLNRQVPPKAAYAAGDEQSEWVFRTDSVRTGQKERGYCKQLQEMQSVLQYFYPKNQYSLMKFSSNLFILEGRIFVSSLAQD